MTVVQTIAEKIKTRGYWAVTIRPATFVESRVPNRDQLFELVYDRAVSINGRTIPSVDGAPESLIYGPDWIEFSSEWGADLQCWRFYQSGQFVLLMGVWTDWEGSSPWRPISPAQARSFPLWDSLATFVSIYEFAARLSLTAAGSDHMVVSTMIKNLRDVQLVQDNPSRSQIRHRVFPYETFSYPNGRPAPIARELLISDASGLAAEAGNALLQQFGFPSSIESVQQWQAEYWDR